LIGVGVRADRVHVARLCTLTHRGIFESYRGDGERAGRMAALIAVP
jgi:copper oxidase (laccase) domain-containing protein